MSMVYFKRLTGLSEILKFSATLILICSVLVSTDLLWRWDQLVYDGQQRLLTRPAPRDVIIVAIDEASLSQIGRWPWRRNIHAELINRLDAEGARIIAVDIIFAERDRQNPSDDIKLVNAVENSGKVVLPVIAEQVYRGSVLHETLPFPELSESSAALGHVHVELDADGIARSIYLKEGLGAPRWPSFSLAILEILEPGALNNLSGATNREEKPSTSIFKWIRDYHVKIPFYGPPGHFQTISYQQVLKGQYAKDLFKDRIVYVGVTATGLGDSLPTPVSGLNHPMPGVEVNASIFAGLRDGLMIQDIPVIWQYILSILIVCLPIILFPMLRPRLAFLSALLLLVIVMVLTVLLVRNFQLWFSPVSALFTIAISYPIWSWRRLEYTMKYMDSELSMFARQGGMAEKIRISNVEDIFNFISTWMPISGFLLRDKNNKILLSWGDGANYDPSLMENKKWIKKKEKYFCYLNDEDDDFYYCSFTWDGNELPPQKLFKLIMDVINAITKNIADKPKSTYEIVQKRIQEVHVATEKMSKLKQFIESSLNQIADAVLVVDCSGAIILSNERAKSIINLDGKNSLDAATLLSGIEVGPKWSWNDVFLNVFENTNEIQFQGNIEDKYDFLISVSLMHLGEEFEGYAFIISISDISELMKSERKRNEALSFLSHDLRSPLVSILALTQLIENDKSHVLDKANLKRIDHHARRSIELAENFVQFSRTEGNESILFSEVNLIDIVINAIDQVWELAREKNIVIKRTFLTGQCYFNGNAQLMERVFLNLLTNAIKYSDPDRQITVSVNVNSSIQCVVEDQGLGIPAEDLPDIMKRFKRSENHRHQDIQGLGLGLAFVKVVVEKHAGSVSIESQTGVGTKVILDFPK